MKSPKEFFKSFTLYLLISISIVLFIKIGYTEKLWPQGYNFFSWTRSYIFAPIADFFGINGSNPFENDLTVERVISPQSIVLNKGEKRCIINRDEQVFLGFSDDFNKFFDKLTKAGSIKIVQNQDEWFSVLKQKSADTLYFNFGNYYSAEMWYKSAGISVDRANNILPVKNVIISSKDAVYGRPAVYYSYENGNVLKISYYYDSEIVAGFIDKYASSLAKTSDLFSYEINSANTTLDPNTLISFESFDINKIDVSIPLALENSSKLYFDSILDTFGFNHGSVRRYVETNNTVLFVDNFASLKIHPSGTIEYEAVDEGNAVMIYNDAKDNAEGLYEILTSCVKFAGQTIHTTGTTGAEIHLENSIKEISQSGIYELKFNYYLGRYPVIFSDDTGTGHGIEMIVSDGRLKRYKQHIRQFNVTGQTQKTKPMLIAMDEIYKYVSTNNAKQIKDIFIAYNEAGNSLYPVWIANITDGNIMVRGVE